VIARFEELMGRIAAGHAPEFAAADVTMAQMKALYLVSANGSLHISALAELLGVTLSTGSGLVDRLVDQGLLERRHDEVDRRHVVVRLSERGAGLVEQLRELNSRRMRSMISGIDDDDLAALGRVLTSFIAQVTAENAAAAQPQPPAQQAAPRQEGTR
jgi:DNA-binding MarR family transcriptional regulator